MHERDLFMAALQIEDAAARSAYLDRACAGDAALRRRVEALLAALEQAGSFLQQPAGELRATSDFSHPGPLSGGNPAEGPGTVLGPYRLIEQIGEGGMGTVWMAQQTEPVRRLVAVKLVKAGMDSRQVVARFEAERQALALMDHPHIARIHDGGTMADGRPFFVMELVKGIPFTDYCDQCSLTARERLDLFVLVCQAVQHAHQKGVIHRDLKPSNVLVAIQDGRPTVKVIDFGLAKAINQRLSEHTLRTGFHQLIGTPLYMSPEQAEMSPLDVDTRADIYALGVLLYELLTGTTPFEKERLGKVGYDELRRIIREEEPPRPSARLSTLGGKLTAVAAQRRTEPRHLSRTVKGELDWVVMKALEKDRNRRYESASAFAADVQRYLADEPVYACPPSTGYRLRKFARRNKGPVLAASLVVLALVAGVVGTSLGLIRAEQRAEGERRAKGTAEKRLAQIEKGIDLLGSLFADLDPFAEEKEGRLLRALLGDRLDRAAAELEGDAVGDPLVVARLQERLGQTYLGLGHAARAEALFTKAVTTRQAHLGAYHPDTLSSLHHQARAYEAAGKRIEAIIRFGQVHDARATILGADHLDTLSTLHELAEAHWRAGQWTVAIPLLEQVRDGRVKQLGEDHDQTLATLGILARAYAADKRFPDAIALAEQVRDARVNKHGEGHPHAIAAMVNLAWTYQRCYKMRQAFALFKQARETAMLKLGPNHPQTLNILHGVAHMHRVYRETPEAIALLEQVREKQVVILGDHHPATLGTLWALAMAYQDAGELNKALPLLQQAAVGAEKLDYATDTADLILHHLASCHEQLKQYHQAEVWRRKWVAAARASYGPESLQYTAFFGLSGLGSNLVQQQKYADAEPILRESLAILQKNHPEIWETFRAQSLLGAALLGQQKYTEAEPHLVQGYQGLKKLEKSQGHKSDGPSEALERLVQLYDAWDKPDEAAKWRKEREKMKEQP
jgi:serine/threonine protein kinase/tetratricopeptide (TPR) repeat protein